MTEEWMMSNAKRCLILPMACLLLFASHGSASAVSVIVLDQSIRPVSAVSGGRFYRIVWDVKLRNLAPKPQVCEITVSFQNAAEEEVGKTTKTQRLTAREVRTVRGTVQLRASLVRKIASCAVSLKILEPDTPDQPAEPTGQD